MNLDYLEIQTPPDVWTEILKLLPIRDDAIFLEPFKGQGSLYNQVTCLKEWCEIEEGRDIFNYDCDKSIVTTIYTNPPFKCEITNKKGQKVVKNAVYYFLEYFMEKITSLEEVGFLINAKSWNSITPKRLSKLQKLGFYIHNIIVLNCNYWYGTYYFVLFKKYNSNLIIPIEKTFLK